MAWTEERVDILKKLWAQGLSASQIANRLGGVTRNAVIGKVYRLGLSGRAKPTRNKASQVRRSNNTRQKRRQTTRSRYDLQGATALKVTPLSHEPEPLPSREAGKLLPNPLENPALPPGERVTLMMLKRDMCRWPIGDPCEEGFHFCGRPSLSGVSYCEFHARIAFQPFQSRRREGKKTSA